MENYNMKTDTKKTKKYFEGDENCQDDMNSLVDEKEDMN